MAQTPPPLPPACADCLTTVQTALPGVPLLSSPSRMLRSAAGQLRIDYGNTSVIHDPAELLVILLDHANMEARILPMERGLPAGLPVPPAGLPSLAMEGLLPALPGEAAAVMVVELGESIIQGRAVTGSSYTIPASPQDGLGALPGAAQTPTVMEIWTCVETQLPVLSRITSPYGQQTCVCQTARVPDPEPAFFQVPAGYRQLG